MIIYINGWVVYNKTIITLFIELKKMKKIPLSLEELRKSKKPIRNVNIEHKEKLTNLEKFAVWVTEHIGTMGFFFFILILNVVWIAWNVLAPKEMIFDPGWSFLILLFVNNF